MSEREPEGREMVTVAEAARELGLSVEAVHKRLRAGVMVGERISPRLWLVSRAEVERWRVLGRRKPGPVPGGKRAAPDSGHQP